MIHQGDKELKKAWSEIFNQLPVDSKKALKDALGKLHEDALLRSNDSGKRICGNVKCMKCRRIGTTALSVYTKLNRK